ncbi:MAG: T9SS type A sorting domain-containing protein [Saprospiraceae bacterium]
MNRIILFVFVLLSLMYQSRVFSQCQGWTNFQLVTDTFTNPAFGNILSLERDKTGKPFVYLAAKDAGIIVYDISDPGTAVLTANVPTSDFSGFDAINLVQDSVYLYVTLGDIWNDQEESGLAIIDVTDPSKPIALDHYTLTGSQGGAGCVSVRNHFAYLASMRNGLIILDIEDKRNIQFKSQLVFENNFPHHMTGGIGMYNARGIALKDSLAYVCYDRGGLRIVNVSDVTNPVEINKYCFAPLIDKATAYNNIVIDQNLAYVSIDYYGMEILDLTDPMNIIQRGWWHPDNWADTTNDYLVWANSQGHANELAYDPVCKMIYIAAGKSDVVAVSVIDPSHPVTCQTYGSVTDDYGTWGLDLFRDTVYVAYIWTFGFPPFSNYTGFSELAINACATTSIEKKESIAPFFITPNPFFNEIHIEFNDFFSSVQVELLNTFGQLVHQQQYATVSSTTIPFVGPAGLYVLRLRINNQLFITKLVKS